MPQNTPMKRQFTTIDGRTVMSNLPQHWGGNDWKITGVDNPLPVGNYVQTQAGVWIPQKGSDDGAADVRLTGSNIEVLLSGEVQNDFRRSIIYVGEPYKTATGASELRGVDVRGCKEIAFNVINNSDKNIFLRHVYFGDNEYPGRRNRGMIFRLFDIGHEFGVNNEDTSLISRSTISPGEMETTQGDLYKLLKVSYLYFGFSLQTSDNEPIN